MELSKDNKTTIKRMLDLANKSYTQNMFTFTDFLGEGEQSLFYEAAKDFAFVKYQVFGGIEDAERVMIRFGNKEELGYEEDFPIAIIKISPLLLKFSDDLSHRDYLGALMNLGVERSKMGDILINNKTAYLFCEENIKDFIMDNLDKVKHTNVKLAQVAQVGEIQAKEPESKSVMVSSMRVDAIISKTYNLSRSQCIEYFRQKKVFVNGRLFENNSGIIKAEDMISVRGLGRFKYAGIDRETAKGKYMINIKIYK